MMVAILGIGEAGGALARDLLEAVVELLDSIGVSVFTSRASREKLKKIYEHH